MLSQTNSFNSLISRLDEFIRRYYKNQLLKGSIYFVAAFFLAFLLVSVLEHFGRFDTTVRTTLFYTLLLFTLLILYRYVLTPVAGMMRLGKTISYEQASEIIGHHFPEVKDKLLNTLQLQQTRKNNSESELLQASIDQRISKLSPVPFSSAIDFKGNLRYLKYAVIPVIIFFAILAKSPAMITGSSERLIRHSEFFEKQAPFRIEIENKDLKAVQHEDYELKIKVTGDEIPSEVFVVLNGNPVKMRNEDGFEFSHTFKNLQRNTSFKMLADGYNSMEYELEVIAKPQVVNFELYLDYPEYILKKDELQKNSGELTIPAGTKINWKFNTMNAEFLQLHFADTNISVAKKADDQFTYSRRFSRDNQYYVKTSNSRIVNPDSILFGITVIPDEHPQINTEEKRDSLNPKMVYFLGDVKDDYGFKRLAFIYRFSKSEKAKKLGKYQVVNIPLKAHLNEQSFYHYFDLKQTDLEAGDEIEYYFEIWDNDAVNGSKSARSKMMVFKTPGLKEIKAEVENSNNALKEKMQNAITESKSVQKEMKDLQKKMLDKKDLSWNEKKKIEELLKRQKELEKNIEEIKQENKVNNIRQSEFSQENEEILEKQKELERLFDQVMTEEMKELMKQMEELLKMNNKEQIQEELEKMNLNNKEVEKELDRMLEMFKQLEVKQKLEQAVEDLKKLSEEQKKLSEETQQKNSDEKNLEKKQDEIKKEFEEIKKDLDKIEQQNKELENPVDINKDEEDQKQIDKEMSDSKENLNQGKKSKASESQKNAAKKMDEMSKKMQESLESMESKQKEENYESLREITENLIELSYQQEDLMEEFKNVNSYDPKYVTLTQKQKKLKDDAKLIEDSLLALSKRVPMIQSYINKEIGQINSNMDKSIKSLASREVLPARSKQQYVMTSVNNLAVMLSEVLKNMQQEMQGQSEGKPGQCKKPGKGKPSMSDLKGMQEQLNKMMEQSKKPGNSQGQSMSKQLAQMAAQQQAIRQHLQKMQKEMQKEGKGGKSGDLGKMQDLMEQTEKDLVNKKLTPETLKRQQEIMTRMLESEKAEKERELDNKRESKQAEEKKAPIPPSMAEYLKKKEKEAELLKSVSPSLNPYYRNLVREYFNRIGK